jgi:hypothetical protein
VSDRYAARRAVATREATPDAMKIHRYVAVGDSQIEGLQDYRDDGMPRGWADCFAESPSTMNPGLLYANLAVRGKRTLEVGREQFDVDLALPETGQLCFL